MVHGACSSSGCYAMTDEGVAEIYAVAREALKGGQRVFQVQAYPFRMTPRNMAKNRGHPDYAFWQNLKRGYDLFEVTRQPPQVGYCGRGYAFGPQGGEALPNALAQAAKKAGKTIDQFVAEWSVPAKYAGYATPPANGRAQWKSNAEVVWAGK